MGILSSSLTKAGFHVVKGYLIVWLSTSKRNSGHQHLKGWTIRQKLLISHFSLKAVDSNRLCSMPAGSVTTANDVKAYRTHNYVTFGLPAVQDDPKSLLWLHHNNSSLNLVYLMRVAHCSIFSSTRAMNWSTMCVGTAALFDQGNLERQRHFWCGVCDTLRRGNPFLHAKLAGSGQTLPICLQVSLIHV
jgi:hypothetical protein